ncbi:cupin domain-containing protein [Prochlorococcus sp. MIT 1341]
MTLSPEGVEPERFGVDDFVVFPEGMSCTWKVQKVVRKHYRFGN